MHKNHKVAALNSLLYLKNKDKLKNIFIVSSGSKEGRNTKYFYELKKFIDDNKLYKYYKYLGTVSFKEVLSLIYHSVALIQPSKFEGRSSYSRAGEIDGEKNNIIKYWYSQRTKSAQREVFFYK